MRNILYTALLCFAIVSSAIAQKNQLNGTITDLLSNEPLPFAHIINKQTEAVTISNENGYFHLFNANIGDTLKITYIGYHTTYFIIKNFNETINIQLEKITIKLAEVSIEAKKSNYLYELVDDLKYYVPINKTSSKSYFEVKTKIENEQIELVEGFYNILSKGNNIQSMQFKAGRYAHQFNNNRVFVSLESTKTILLHQLFERNTNYPENPLTLNHSKLKKIYHLSYVDHYQNEKNQTIFVINYQPKSHNYDYFNGTMWINTKTKKLLKITMKCTHAKKHPFTSIFNTDKVDFVSLDITKTFTEHNDNVVLNYIDLKYSLEYTNQNDAPYIINTQALLYAYDYDQVFRLPLYNYYSYNTNDYRNINALPYNELFWKYNEELKLPDENNQNQEFFEKYHQNSQQSVLAPNEQFQRIIHEYPFLAWSENRIKNKTFFIDSMENFIKRPYIQGKHFDLVVNIFLDWFEIGDSIHYTSKTIINPYYSYFRRPLDKASLCFINTYFDLIEIERRNLMKKVYYSDQSEETILSLYTRTLENIQLLKYYYFIETDLGFYKNEMLKWNQRVKNNLDIDNINIFKPYEY
jgi:hypothetical protein